MRWVIVLLLAGGVSAIAQTRPPDALRALLVAAREHPLEHLETRGATADFTLIKHQLRDWIESRLTPLNRQDEEVVLAFQLTSELKKAGLNCNYPPEANAIQCPDQNAIGFLGDIKIRRSAGFLVVQTAVGIQCGYDESAYVYEWNEDRWKRFWESEQNDYTKEKYFPQNLEAVLVSPTNYHRGADKTEHLVVTLGTYPWCSSNWQPIYYRIWQVKAGARQAKLLLDENEIGFISVPVQGSVGPSEVLIEYAVASADGGVHNRRQIRHYVLKQNTLERVDPFALSPRGFTDYWITGPSKEILARTAASVRSAFENWSRKFKGPFEFIDSTLHCRPERDLWQVGVQNPDTETSLGYFLIRWQPPYHFSLVGVSEHPWPNCTEPDPQADEFRTLFPDQDHH
jgi:hypothetical protein